MASEWLGMCFTLVILTMMECGHLVVSTACIECNNADQDFVDPGDTSDKDSDGSNSHIAGPATASRDNQNNCRRNNARRDFHCLVQLIP